MKFDSLAQKNKGRELLSGIVIMALICFRLLLTNRIPLSIDADFSHDDGWVISAAVNILEGNWLGDYNQFTLIKGAFSPMFIAAASYLGFSFFGACTIIYIISCLLFVIGLRPVLKFRLQQLTVFTLLLFNPISMAHDTFQKIYRNGFSQWQILLLFSSLIAIYLRRSNLWMATPWALLAGFTLWSFINTREDWAWILPFVVTALSVIFISTFLRNNWKTGRHIIYKICAVTLLPVIITIAGNKVLQEMNRFYYGEPILNDRVSGNFSKVVQDLYQIEPDPKYTKLYTDETQPYAQWNYNIYRDAINKACEASNALNGIKPQIDQTIQSWDSWEELSDGELVFDHMIFALRDAAALAGHYQSLTVSETYWGQVHTELESALKNASLPQKHVGFINNVAPLKEGEWPKVWRALFEMINRTAKFTDVNAYASYARGSAEQIQQAVNLTGNIGMYRRQPTTSVCGWLAVDDSVPVSVAILHNTEWTIQQQINFYSSADIFDYLHTENSRQSRFSEDINGYIANEDLYIAVYDAERNMLADVSVQQGFQAIQHLDNVTYCIDLINMDDSDLNRKSFERYINRTNTVIKIYQVLNFSLFMISLMIYISILGHTVFAWVKKKDYFPLAFDNTLIVTSIFLSMLVFTLAMAYVHVAAFPIDTYLRSSSGYILILMFEGLTVGLGRNLYVGFCTVKGRDAKVQNKEK